MLDLMFNTVGPSDPRVDGAAEDAGASTPEADGAAASFSAALAAYADEDAPAADADDDDTADENLDAAAAAAAAALPAAVTPVVAVALGLGGSSIDAGASTSDAVVTDVPVAGRSAATREETSAAGSVAEVTTPSPTVAANGHGEIGDASSVREEMTTPSPAVAPNGPAAMGNASLPRDEDSVESRFTEPASDGSISEMPTPERRDPTMGRASVPPRPAMANARTQRGESVPDARVTAASTAAAADAPPMPPAMGTGTSVVTLASLVASAPGALDARPDGAHAEPMSDAGAAPNETVGGDLAELAAKFVDDTVARGARAAGPVKVQSEDTLAPETGLGLPTALTGELLERATEAARSVATRPETASPESTLSPYHMRIALAAGADAGWQDSYAGGSRDGATFGFGGQTGSPQLLPALKLAGASFASALASVAEEDSVPAQTATQIVQALKLQWARGAGEAEIRLEPRHFGELRIALKVDDGRVNARLEAEVPVVREWLQTNQAALKSGLAEQNLTLDRFEIVDPKRDPRDRELADDRRRDGQPKPRRDRRRRDQGGELFEVVA